MIRLGQLTLAYGKRTLLHNVDAQFNRGQLTALIGRNGSGKSTLLKTISGLRSGYSGTIVLDGKPLSSITPAQSARTIAMVTTERIRISNLRCRDVVALGRAPYTNWLGRLSRADESAVEAALSDVGMSDYAERTMDKMSDGECQRIMIARALAQDTPIILLDEPTSFLDIPNRHEMCGLLLRLAHDGNKCIVYSTHELDIAMHTADAIALIDNPTLHLLPPDQMYNSGILDRVFFNDQPTRTNFN